LHARAIHLFLARDLMTARKNTSFVMPSARLNDPAFVARLGAEYPWWYRLFLCVLVSPYIWFWPRSRQALYVDFVHRDELSKNKKECELCMEEAYAQLRAASPEYITANTNANHFGNLAYIALHGPSHRAKLCAHDCLHLLTMHHRRWFYSRFLPIFLSPLLLLLVFDLVVQLGIA